MTLREFGLCSWVVGLALPGQSSTHIEGEVYKLT